jgi:CAAX prenyl protease-like protein
MDFLREKLRASPIHARFAPYAIILVLTFVQDGVFNGAGRYWMYLAKMLVGLWCIWQVRDLVTEARWAISWEAVVVGVGICAVWVGLDPYYPKNEILMKAGKPWNPFAQFGEGTAMGWFFVAVRTLGSAIVVPPLEEAFFRSFVYRYFVKTDFESMPLNRFHPISFVVTSLCFGAVHYQWLGGIICGMAFQWLVIRKNRLGDAMTAHAITNFLLGVWIVWKGAWIFW